MSFATLEISPPIPPHATLHLDGLDFNCPTPLAGFKDLPQGWHLLAWSSRTPEPGSSGNGSEAMGGIVGRHGVLLHAKGSATLCRAWDEDTQSLRREGQSTLASPQQQRQEQAAFVPYPLTPSQLQAWSAQTINLQAKPNVVQRVLGVECEVDTAYGVRDAEAPLGQKTTDAERKLEELLGGDAREQMMLFTKVRLRKSWGDATGEERSRWSIDKSLALKEAIDTAGDVTAILAELELAFLLFVNLQSSSSLSQWQVLIEAFCRSGTLMGAHPPHTTSSSPAIDTPPRLADAHARFLRVLTSQLSAVSSDFFADSGSSLSEWLEGELTHLRGHMVRALAVIGMEDVSATAYATQAASVIAHEEPDELMTEGVKMEQAAARQQEEQERPATTQLIGAWRSLSLLLKSRFAIDLDRELDEERARAESEEEGDNAPVIVEM